jgi:hypothetical protein
MKINRSIYMNYMGLPSVGLEARSLNFNRTIYMNYLGLPRILRFVARSKLIAILLILAIDAAFILIIYQLL